MTIARQHNTTTARAVRWCATWLVAALLLLAGPVAVMVSAAAPASAQVPPQPVCHVALPCKLSTGLDDARVIDQVEAPDDERVVFQHVVGTGPIEIYSALANGDGFPRRLSLARGSAQLVAVSPDSTRVLYTLPAPTDPSRRELFSVPIAGPASASVRTRSSSPGVRSPRTAGG